MVGGDVEEAGDLTPYLPEHGAHVQRRGQHAARLEQRGEPPVLPLAAPVQARVPDRRRRLLAERTRQLHLARVEDPRVLRLDEHQDAQRLPLDDERYVETGLLPPPLHGPAHVLREAFVRERLLNDPALRQDPPVARVVVQRVDAGVVEQRGRGAGAVERPADDGVAYGVVLVDDALLCFQRFGRRAADVRERVLEGDAGGDGTPRVQQRGEIAVLLLLQAEEARVAHRHRGRAGQEGDELGVLVGEGAALSLLGEHQTADDSEVAEAQRDGQLLQLAPHLHRRLIGRVETGVADPGDAGPGALDDGHVTGAVVDAQAGADPRQVGRSEVARPDGRGGEGPRGGVVLVEVALPDVQSLGDEAGDDGRGVVAGERSGDLRAGLDRQAQALAPGRQSHAPVLGVARRRYHSGAATPATISSKHGNTQTPQPTLSHPSCGGSLPDGTLLPGNPLKDCTMLPILTPVPPSEGRSGAVGRSGLFVFGARPHADLARRGRRLQTCEREQSADSGRGPRPCATVAVSPGESL